MFQIDHLDQLAPGRPDTAYVWKWVVVENLRSADIVMSFSIMLRRRDGLAMTTDAYLTVLI